MNLALRLEPAPLLDALRAAGAQIARPAQFRCPFHDDRNPSAGIYQADDGHWAFKCHGCGFQGDVFDVRKKSGSAVVEHDPLPPPKAYPTIDALVASITDVEVMYRYTNPDNGIVDLLVVRYRGQGDSKIFIQASKTDAGWIKRAAPKPWPIYNRARIKTVDRVVVVEGEKCVHALYDVGVVATTSPGGAGKAQHADWSPLQDKTVILWPDNDPPNQKGERTGIAHMQDVRRCLEALDNPPRILWIDPDTLDLPPKGDAADYVAALRDVNSVIASAQSVGAAAETRALLDDTITGHRRAIDWPWRMLSWATKALLPGTITILCGDPGSAKSFMLLQSAIYWHQHQVPIAVLELEELRSWHSIRALALKTGVKALLDDEWVRDNPDEATSLFDMNQEFIDSFGQCLFDSQAAQTLDDVQAWITARAMAGVRIIAVDPITAAFVDGKPWIADTKFINDAKKIAEQFECSIVFVTHPRKGVKGSSMLEDMAGGSAYARFSHCVMWLKHHHPVKQCVVKSIHAFGTEMRSIDADRTLMVRKARNGMGTGMEIAFTFDGKSLHFDEHGIVVRS